MTISSEALEKARAIDWTRIDDALISCAGLLKTLCRDNIGDTAASELEYARSVIAALQAERDAAAPKLPDDLAGLVEQLEKRVLALRCVLKQTATTKYDADLSERAAATIQSLVARNAELEMGLEDLLSWFPDKPSEPEWRIKAGNYGADAAVSVARSLLNKDRQP